MTEDRMNDSHQSTDPTTDSSKLEMLLVEDQQDVRTVFALMLSAQGFAVNEMATGEAAIQFCEKQLPAVALIDADLDGYDGMSVGAFIRGLPGGDNVLLGTLTGNESCSCRDKAIESGFDFHFIKPVKMKEVCEVIKSRLEGDESSLHSRWSLDRS